MKKFFIYVLLLISGVVISSQSFGQLTFYINEVEVEINNSYTIIISFNEDTIYNVVGQIPIIEKSKINNENLYNVHFQVQTHSLVFSLLGKELINLMIERKWKIYYYTSIPEHLLSYCDHNRDYYAILTCSFCYDHITVGDLD